MLQVMPRKEYPLKNGRLGTEYECLQEQLKEFQARHLHTEMAIEEINRRLLIAEGRPTLK